MDIDSIKRLEVRPGDRLVVSTIKPLTQSQRDHMRSQLERIAPGVPFLVLEGDFQLRLLGEAELEALRHTETVAALSAED